MVDTFEKFAFTCLKYCGLDPCHYFSVPGLSRDAMLKMAGVTLEKINDPNKYMFFEQGKSIFLISMWNHADSVR